LAKGLTGCRQSKFQVIAIYKQETQNWARQKRAMRIQCPRSKKMFGL